jgi:uncharacterized Zn finger protein
MKIYCNRCGIKEQFVEIFCKDIFHIMECIKCGWIIRKIIRKGPMDFTIINSKRQVEIVDMKKVIV